MTAAGFPITRAAIDNARRQDVRLEVFTTLTETERNYLRWALDRWPDADLSPLAVAGTSAAEIIAKSGRAPATSNTSQPRPPYSRKDALRTVPHGGGAPSDNSLNGKNNLNASYRQLKPTVISPVRTMGTVRSRGNGAAPIHDPDQEQFEAEEGHRGSAGDSAGKSPA
jgi:hypothetical protein